MIRQHMLVHGLVQGVGFRYYTQHQAAKYRINGWVRNNDDGTVEIDAEGAPEKLVSFVAAVKKGPRFSRVSQVNLRTEKELKHYRRFIIQN